jgi:hypothetical protein
MRTLLVLVLCSRALMAQHPRDSWKLKPFDLEAHLTHTLADAALTSSERGQIYRILDQDFTIPSGTQREREEERKAIMSFRVGSIALALDGSQQLLVRATKDFCGATGNCSMWILVRKAGQLQLALGTEGQLLIVRNSSSRGFHDIAIGLHDSAFIEQYAEYRWDGTFYEQVDCYLRQYPATTDRPEQPAIIGCQ